jgi:hypothetical protein
MLVRNIKCELCGGNKVTTNKSTYIYCDYCGMWMGLDFGQNITESASVFSGSNSSRPEVKEFIDLVQKIGPIMQSRNIEEFVTTQCRVHELEFEIFPERFGPKGKQKSFQKKYLEFYRAFYTESIDDDWFDEIAARNQAFSASDLKFTIINGKVVYEFNEDFKKLIDLNYELINKGFAKTRNLKSLALHPEDITRTNPEVTRQISIMAFLQAFSAENTKQIIEYLDIKHDYIEIPEVNFQNTNCSVCSGNIAIPEGSEKVVCESCGCTIKTGTQNIQCYNCGSLFDFSTTQTCNFCGTRVEMHKGISELVSEKHSETSNTVLDTQSKQKKGFFARLFK